MAKGTNTRTRIMEIAQDAILAKGFDGTSIDEIIAAADISKGGFFYHFPDKSALARALIERHIDIEDALFDDLWTRSAELSEDPLHRTLIGLKLLAELIEDMPNGHPGCIVATAAYQDRIFDADVRDLNRVAVLGWRRRFQEYFEEAAAVYPIRDGIDLADLADMATAVVEGGIVTARAMQDPKLTSRQIMMFRHYVKLLFSPSLQ